MTAQNFLAGLALHADAGHLALWTLAARKSTWLPLPLTPPDDLPPADLYVGVATSALDLGPKQRVKAAEAHSLLALVADIDIAHPLHSKAAQLPQTEAEALQIIADTNLQPTALVHSGHGLQAWWCLKEQWLLDSDAEREAAMDLAADWGATVAEHARRRGRTVDSVHDLARLMRVPGTINAKDKQHPVPVELREADWERRYNPDDFRDLLVDVAARGFAQTGAKKASRVTGQKRTADAAGAILAQAARFPLGKHEALLENIPNYKRSWEHKRTDGDTSLSAYDLSLVSIAAQAGWTDEELAALIREHRAKYQDTSGKANRADYVAGTISKAAEHQQAAQARETILHTDADTQDPEQSRCHVAESLQINLTHIRRVTGACPIFLFTISGKDASLPVEELLNQHAFRKAVFRSCGTLPAQFGKTDWPQVCEHIYHSAEVVDTGSETELRGELMGIIEEFVADRSYQTLEDNEQPDHVEVPFVREGHLHFRLRDLMAYLSRSPSAKSPLLATRSKAMQLLRSFGAEQVKFSLDAKTPSGRTTVSLIRLPAEDVLF